MSGSMRKLENWLKTKAGSNRILSGQAFLPGFHIWEQLDQYTHADHHSLEHAGIVAASQIVLRQFQGAATESGVPVFAAASTPIQSEMAKFEGEESSVGITPLWSGLRALISSISVLTRVRCDKQLQLLDKYGAYQVLYRVAQMYISPF